MSIITEDENELMGVMTKAMDEVRVTQARVEELDTVFKEICNLSGEPGKEKSDVSVSLYSLGGGKAGEVWIPYRTVSDMLTAEVGRRHDEWMEARRVLRTFTPVEK